ncbi:CoA transferase [Sphingomonas sp. CL5.1]|uniref:CaiB/BaiF CoA transferase family protein n=1 Tax=Sphingomonas sp. CL5.1 TaxID=2653203 RepID=UPI0015822F19|nr:CaiB/BaiF CoA-transferase family protein [Sphingomonas sp. CL5.1]QKS00615.1 CoA transferase [Sphingomonas sp. CL5.1]
MARPLAGIRVLEIAAYVSGPYAGSLLAALGAEVVKIEPPQGDAFRIGRGTESPFFAQYNAGKKSVVVDLKAAEGMEVARAMVPRFDVLIENMRPGKLAALGLDPDACRALNPSLIYTSISGFGSGGPWADRPAYDSIGQALGGFYTIMNDAGKVRLTGTCIADLVTAIGSTLAILAALVGRGQKQGAGMHIETSMFEAMSLLTIDAMTQALHANIDPVRETRHPQAQNFCLRTATGDYLVVHLSSSQKFWRGLMEAIGRPELADDARFSTYQLRAEPERFAEIKAIVEEAVARMPRDECERRLAKADVPFAPALTMREIADHPQMRWLGILGGNAAKHRLVDPPWRLNGERPRRTPHVPEIGENTCDVFAEFIDPKRFAKLTEQGIIGIAQNEK